MKKIILCLIAMMGIITVSAQQKVECDAQAAINNIRKFMKDPCENCKLRATRILCCCMTESSVRKRL